MTHTIRKFMPAVLALSFAVVYPAAHALNSSGSAASPANSADTTHRELTSSGAITGSRDGDSLSNGKANASSQTGRSAGAGVASADEDKAVKSLLAAAQMLRESIQRMAQAPVGEGRTEAIKEGNEALMQVNAAILALPSHLLLAGGSENDYSRAVSKMQGASDKLYAAVHALAREPGSAARNRAIREVNMALADTNMAMVNGLYLQMDQTGGAEAGKTASSGKSTATSGASGTAGSNLSGSATRTGRPPANNVDLSSAASGASTKGTGTGGSNQTSR